MLIIKGLGIDGTGPGGTTFVPICGTDMAITSSSSSRLISEELLTSLNMVALQTTPIITTNSTVLKSSLTTSRLVPTISSRAVPEECGVPGPPGPAGEDGVDGVDGQDAADVLYTGTAERTVGGINDSDEFVEATMVEMWDALIKQEKFPSLTGPSHTFSSTATGFREVGLVIASIEFTSTFDRGSITPQYTALSPYRSGEVNTYNYNGTGLTTISKTDNSDIQSITNYTVVANGQSWTSRVNYDAGVQPKSSYDNDYGTPLSAGTTGVITKTITGVLPVYATNTVITELTDEPLQANGAMIQIDFIAENGSDKQTVDFPGDVVLSWGTIVRIEFYDTSSSVWKTINNTDEASVATFDITATTHTVQGVSRDYIRYTHNGPTTGARLTRWYIS